MTAIIDKDFDRHLRPRERHRGFPRLALRQRSADHPMIMFFLVVAAAFMAMAMVPSSGSAFATIGNAAAPEAEPDRDRSTVGLSEIEIACQGQAWGSETAECLATIARDAGRVGGRKVRVITGL